MRKRNGDGQEQRADGAQQICGRPVAPPLSGHAAPCAHPPWIGEVRRDYRGQVRWFIWQRSIILATLYFLQKRSNYHQFARSTQAPVLIARVAASDQRDDHVPGLGPTGPRRLPAAPDGAPSRADERLPPRPPSRGRAQPLRRESAGPRPAVPRSRSARRGEGPDARVRERRPWCAGRHSGSGLRFFRGQLGSDLTWAGRGHPQARSR